MANEVRLINYDAAIDRYYAEYEKQDNLRYLPKKIIVSMIVLMERGTNDRQRKTDSADC